MAIEIHQARPDLIFFTVLYRYVYANRDRRAIVEAASNSRLRGALEGLPFGLYRGGADEGAT